MRWRGTFDDTVNPKISWRSSPIRAVEFSAINKSTTIVHSHRVRRPRANIPTPRLNNLVLQTARQHNHAFLLRILFQELLSLPKIVATHVGALDRSAKQRQKQTHQEHLHFAFVLLVVFPVRCGARCDVTSVLANSNQTKHTENLHSAFRPTWKAAQGSIRSMWRFWQSTGNTAHQPVERISIVYPIH